MPRTPGQRAKHKRNERSRRRRRMLERRDDRVTVWFPKPEDKAESPRPATLDDEILEMQRALLLDEDI